MIARALLAAALAIALAAPPADAKLDPARRWRTAETPHFVIHFPEDCGQLAAHAARVAEDVHERLAPRIGWEPRARTRLVITDDTDAAAGWASPYPYNQMFVSATPPVGEPGFGTTVHDDWLRLVITHEYTHVLQLDMASRLPLALRSVFGRLYFPNALQPEWLSEGLATFEETELTAGGRGRSPGAEMVMRMAALDGAFPTLDEMAVFPDRWPAGQVPYLFGESLTRHLAERFGRERLAQISRDYAGRPLPYFVESAGWAALGTGYLEPWQEWSEALRQRFREQERAVAAQGLTRSTALTSDGRFNGSPAWSPDGARIAWLRADGRDFPGIWVMNADGSGSRRLVKNAFSTASSGATLAWSPDGARLYYTKQGVVRGAAVHNDLWSCDSRTGRETRLTRGLRARDPNPSPDGWTLALVTAGRGLTRLALLDLGGPLPAVSPSRLRHLTEASPEQFAEPRWSPDGSLIAVSVRAPDGEKFVRVLAADGSTVAEVGRDQALDGAPAWSPDGRRLYLSSDRTGIFNLFLWDLSRGELSQVTNVIGGAFSPAPSPDGRRLAFADYSARGYDLRVFDLPSAAPGAGEARSAAHPDATPTPAEATVRLDSRPYSPLDTVLPRLWMPWLAVSPQSGTLVGFLTGGQDVLQRHRYLISALVGVEESRFMHTFDYAYDRWRPTLRFVSTDLDRTWAGLLREGAGKEGSEDYTERERTAGVEATVAFPGFVSSQAVTAGYRLREVSALSPLPPRAGYHGRLPEQGSLGAVRLAWEYSSARRQTFSISPEGGRNLLLAVERSQEGFGSDISFTRAAADWTEYLALPWERHVLQARLFVGGASGETPGQGAFGLGGGSPGDLPYSVDDRYLPLRGYPPNAVLGDRAVLAGLEYRFPLLEIGRGGSSAPLFLRRLHGALFVDAGNAWDSGGFEPADLRTGLGAELRLDVTFSYYVPLTVILGVAWGLDEEGGVCPTLGVRMPQGLLGSATSTRRR